MTSYSVVEGINPSSSWLIRLLRHRAFLPLCFGVFFAIRLALVLLVPIASPSSDSGWYLSRAITLLEQGSYSERGIPTAYWPVGYPAFLALLFKLSGPSLLVAQLANLALGAISFWLLYFVTQRLFGSDLVANLAVLLMTLYPNNAAYVPLLLTEPLYTCLLLSATLLLMSRATSTRIVLAGVAFGLATLVKAQTILLIPVLCFLAFLENWSLRNALRAVIMAALSTCVTLAVVAPWTIRNFNVFHSFVLVSTNGGMSLLAGNNPSVVGDYSKDYSEDDPLMAAARFSVEDQIGADRRARALAREWIATHPIQFLALIPKKLFRLWAPDGEGEWGYQDTSFYEDHRIWFRSVRIANQAYYVIALILFAAALWKLVKRPATPRIYYGAAAAFVLTLISMIFSGQSRYHFPVMPFVFAYAAWVVVGSSGQRSDTANRR